MDEQSPKVFPDVEQLLEASVPRPRVPWVGLAVGVSVSMLVVAAFTGGGGEGGSGVSLFASTVAAGMLLVLPLILRWTLSDVRAEQAAVAGLAELVQLRRWPEASAGLINLLSRPMRAMQLRSEALVYFAAVLARYHQFAQAIELQTYLLDNEFVADGTAYGLKLGRAMAMLREGQLVDADQALSDLRRSGPRDSGAFALVEMYRDVMTGHAEEALELFHKRLPVMREQLGHRLGDAFALAARAYDLRGQTAEAANAFSQATLLAPVVELCRRYPEATRLLGRYEPSPAPAEMA